VSHPVFLSPLGALIAAVAILPLVAVLLRERRGDRVRTGLALSRAPLRTNASIAVAAVTALTILAVAAAQPALRVHGLRHARTDAEVYLVLDVSKSMSASAHQGSATRLHEAVAAARKIGAGLSEIPTGVATLTDRVLPSLLPTTTPGAVDTVLRDAVQIDQPPPYAADAERATSLLSLQTMGFDNFFGHRAKRRLVVLLSDGESVPYYPLTLATTLEVQHIGLVVVRAWGAKDRIRGGKKPDPYRADPSTTAPLDALARLMHGRVYDVHDAGGALRAARADLGTGPTVVAGKQVRTVPLDRYVVLAVAFPLGFALARRSLS
jgi:hypothetical protein